MPNPKYLTVPPQGIDVLTDLGSGVVVPLSGEWNDSPNGSVFLAPPTRIDFGPASQLDYVGFRAFGETPMSVKELCAKLTPYINASIVVDPSDAGEWIRMRVPNSPPSWVMFGASPIDAQTTSTGTIGLSGNYTPSWLTYFAHAYVGYRGGIRRAFSVTKLTGNDVSPVHWATYESFSPALTHKIKAYAVPPSQFVDQLNQYSAVVGNMDIAPLLEVVVPSTIANDYHVNGHEQQSWSYINHYFQLGNGAAGTQVRWVHWVGAADDACFVRFVGFPSVVSYLPPRQ